MFLYSSLFACLLAKYSNTVILSLTNVRWCYKETVSHYYIFHLVIFKIVLFVEIWSLIVPVVYSKFRISMFLKKPIRNWVVFRLCNRDNSLYNSMTILNVFDFNLLLHSCLFYLSIFYFSFLFLFLVKLSHVPSILELRLGLLESWYPASLSSFERPPSLFELGFSVFSSCFVNVTTGVSLEK